MGIPEVLGEPAKVISHPACAKEATRWLERIATPKEADRTQKMLDSLTAAQLAATGELDVAADTQKTKKQTRTKQTAALPTRGGQGWSYAATARALTIGPAATLSNTAAGNSSGTWGSGASGQQAAAAPAPAGASDVLDSAALEEELAALMCGLPGGRGVPASLGGGAPGRPKSAPSNRELRTLMVAAAHRAEATAAALAANSALRREARPGSPSGRSAAAGSSASAPTASAAKPSQSPEVTSYQMAFHLAHFYPELYAQAVAATASEPVPNYTLISDWGDSLKAGEDAEWRRKFFRSVYAATNAEVYKAQGVDAAGSADAAKEAAFHKWMARQQTYYRDLLKEGAPRAEVDALLAGVPVDKKREALEVLRQLTAVTRPDMLKSHSQATHCHMVRAEDEELTALVREQTRDRTMGRPPPRAEGTYATIDAKIRERDMINAMRAATGAHMGGDGAVAGRPSTAPLNVARRVDLMFGAGGGAARAGGSAGSGPRRPSTPGGVNMRPSTPSGLRPLTALATRQADKLGRGAAGGGGGGVAPAGAARPFSAAPTMEGGAARASGPRLKGPPVRLEKETFKSKLPLKWAVAAAVPVTTSYVDAYGSLSGGARASSAGGLSRPIRYREVTCPIGAVNPHTAMAPDRPVYPIPECYLRSPPFPQGPGDVTMETLHRATFKARAPEDVERSLRAAAEQTVAAHKMALKSSLPLGKNGIALLESRGWVSDYDDNYVPHRLDVAGDYARAQGLKTFLTGPTASAGRLTARHPLPGGGPSLHAGPATTGALGRGHEVRVPVA